MTGVQHRAEQVIGKAKLRLGRETKGCLGGFKAKLVYWREVSAGLSDFGNLWLLSLVPINEEQRQADVLAAFGYTEQTGCEIFRPEPEAIEGERCFLWSSHGLDDQQCLDVCQVLGFRSPEGPASKLTGSST